MPDVCVMCGDELAPMERNRSECWSCQDKFSVTYSDDFEHDGDGMDL
jgi:hypothetical protein